MNVNCYSCFNFIKKKLQYRPNNNNLNLNVRRPQIKIRLIHSSLKYLTKSLQPLKTSYQPVYSFERWPIIKNIDSSNIDWNP